MGSALGDVLRSKVTTSNDGATSSPLAPARLCLPKGYLGRFVDAAPNKGRRDEEFCSAAVSALAFGDLAATSQ
jgi:hypothetical protein